MTYDRVPYPVNFDMARSQPAVLESQFDLHFKKPWSYYWRTGFELLTPNSLKILA